MKNHQPTTHHHQTNPNLVWTILLLAAITLAVSGCGNFRYSSQGVEIQTEKSTEKDQ